jgi:hypothetical protein
MVDAPTLRRTLGPMKRLASIELYAPPDFQEVDLGRGVTSNQRAIMPCWTTGGWGEGIRGGGPRASTKTRAPSTLTTTQTPRTLRPDYDT